MDAQADSGTHRIAVLEIARRPRVTTALILAASLLVVVPWVAALLVNAGYVRWLVGIDADIYFSAARTWLASGQWYLPRQLAGPYGIEYGDVLYPPLLLYLVVPFQALPFVLWWAVPIGATLVALRRIEPPRWIIPAMLVGLAWPLSIEEVIKGNPVIWMLSAEALAIAWGGPATLVLVKVSLFPFALIGIRHRAWWILLAVMAIASLPVLGLTLQYPRVILNSEGGGLLYSIRDVPLLLVPVLAGLASGRLRIPTRHWADHGNRSAGC